ncbi:MAG: DUF2927 domain-containing protein [Pseudomonadota bacterium]
MARVQIKFLLAGATCLALSGCIGTPVPVAPPVVVPVAPPEPTPKSAAATAYYAQVQQVLLREGMLRTDPGADIPVRAERLTENFLRIALFQEFTRSRSGITRAETASPLTRWNVPVRVAVRFGASVPADKQATDRARIASYLARLSQITGHPIGLTDAAPNFWVYVVSEDEREALGPELDSLRIGIAPDVIQAVTRMGQTTYCNVFAISGSESHLHRHAVAVIRAENPDLLRLSCFHEEIAQGLGLPNDSPRARPSIFNDDEEFALLTDQDEHMLRILYSPELRPGMTADEARPVVESLARRLTGGES